MNSSFPIVLFLALGILVQGCSARSGAATMEAGAAAGAKQVGKEPGRALLWADEFNGTVLDEDNWNFELGDGCPNLCGWGNNERQVYTDQNHRVENGKLYLQVRREGEAYTSTRITTQGKRTAMYGKIEARAKVPDGVGLWPAFWMLGENITEVGWPMCGEIDILEYLGRKPGQVWTTVHTKAGYGNAASSKISAYEDIETGFHRFACEWTPEQVAFFVDDRLLYTYAPADRNPENWPFDQPFFIILNVAAGGNLGGKMIDDAALPQEFIIDYVRVYGPA